MNSVLLGVLVFSVSTIPLIALYFVARRFATKDIQQKKQKSFWKFDAPVGTEIWRSPNDKHRIIKAHASCWQIQYRLNTQEEWLNGNMLHYPEDVELFIKGKP